MPTTFVVPSRGAFSFAADARQQVVEQPDVVQPEVVQPEPVAIDEPPERTDGRVMGEAELHVLLERIRADGRAEKAALSSKPRRPQDWRRLGIAAGALIVGAGLVGGIAGVSGSAPEPADGTSVNVPLPEPATSLTSSDPSGDFDAEAEAQVRAENLAAAKRMAALHRKIDQLIIPPEMQAETPKAPTKGAEARPEATPAVADTGVDPLAPKPEAETAVAAQMPLSKATIARTIEKIGYPCGDVASIATVDAGGGVFKVSCSSGHSYRAAPTAGRYRFKKWSGA